MRPQGPVHAGNSRSADAVAARFTPDGVRRTVGAAAAAVRHRRRVAVTRR